MEEKSNGRKSEQFNIKSTTENKHPIGLIFLKEQGH
jgi:hypothetical protein